MSNYLKELIREELELLDAGKIGFLIYPGGSGGEFMTLKACEYSNDNYYQHRYTHSKALNRYKIHNGFFHNAFCDSIINSSIDVLNFEDLYNSIPTDLQERLTIQYEDRVNALSSGQVGLCRTHVYYSKCMDSNNTWYLYPDTEEMKDYTNSLSFIKRFFDIETISGVVSNLRDQKFIDEFLRLTALHNIRELEYMRIVVAQRGTYDIEYALKMDLSELVQNPIIKSYLNTRNFYDKNILNDDRLIYMSRMTEPGYIEEKFNITNDGFNKDLTNWHNINLELIEKYKEYL